MQQPRKSAREGKKKILADFTADGRTPKTTPNSTPKKKTRKRSEGATGPKSANKGARKKTMTSSTAVTNKSAARRLVPAVPEPFSTPPPAAATICSPPDGGVMHESKSDAPPALTAAELRAAEISIIPAQIRPGICEVEGIGRQSRRTVESMRSIASELQSAMVAKSSIHEENLSLLSPSSKPVDTKFNREAVVHHSLAIMFDPGVRLRAGNGPRFDQRKGLREYFSRVVSSAMEAAG
jgi:hypothetical protein